MVCVTRALAVLLILAFPIASICQETAPPATADTPQPAENAAEKPAENPADKPAEPATQPATGEFLAEVKEVKGTVEIQASDKDKWVPAVVGMRFGEGSKVCTGFQSAVLIEFGDSSIVLLKDLTQVTIDKLYKDANAVEAKMNMEVGRARVFVKKQEIRTDFRVSTPRLTAAVKGTAIEFETSPDYGDSVNGFSGDTELQNEVNELLNVGEGDSTDQWLLNPLDTIVFDNILELSPDGIASFESQSELQDSLEQEVGLTTSDLGTDTGQPSLDNENADSADLPTYSGGQYLTELQQLSNLGYSTLSSYLQNGGSASSALSDVTSFESTYGIWSEETMWMRNLVASSAYGPELMELYGGP
ncbi:MAG: FecR domain-containing protein [Planctomycetota bacterium]|nr:FecR domain-containing protein [Planctomycetota bacterium]